MAELSKSALKLLGDFPEKAQSMSTEDLKKELIKCQRAISATKKDKDSDQKLEEAKAKVDELSEPYDEIIKENKAMSEYIVYTLDERGAP